MMSKIIKTLVVVGFVLVGIAGWNFASSASAQMPGGSGGIGFDAPGGPGMPGDGAGIGMEMGGQLEHPHGGPARGPGGMAAVALIRATALESGITFDEVIQELEQGKSLAQIAEDHGSSGDDVVQRVVSDAQERMDESVAIGMITQDVADERLAELTDRATEVVNDNTIGDALSQRRQAAQQRIAVLPLVKAAADVTGLDIRDIGQRLRDGETLEAIVTAEGASSSDVIDAATLLVQDHLNQAVEDGRMTQEDADDKLQTFTDIAADVMTMTRDDLPQPPQPPRSPRGW